MVPNSPRMPRLGRKGVSGDVGTKKTKKDEETKTGFFVLKKLLPYALRHKGALGLSLLLAIAAVVMQLYIPILFGKAIDHVVADGLFLGFSQLFTGVVTILMTLVFMFSTNVPVSGIVVVLTPLSFLVAAFISRRSYRLFKEQSVLRDKQVALIDEMVGNQKVVKAFGYGDRASARFGELNNALTKCSRLAVFYSSLANPST